jgi:hypothetical protein
MVIWLRSNTLVALTLLGLLIYAMFSIPADFFYAALGTTPIEVGYTYATILSGSTLGALLIVGVTLIVLIYLGSIFGIIVIYIRQIASLRHYLRHPKLFFTSDRKLSADDFELSLAARKEGHNREVWEDLEPALRRRRAFEQIKDPKPLDISELKKIRKSVSALMRASINSPITRFLRPRIWHIPAIFVLLIATTIILTLNARAQARDIINGKADVTGGRLGLFGYHVESVTVKPAGSNNDKTVKLLDKESVFLLGQNSQYIILYDAGPKQHQTIRVPTAEVVVASSP